MFFTKQFPPLARIKTILIHFLKIKNNSYTEMTTHNFSIEDLAQSLVVHLDRHHIFPPLINNPESFLPPIDNMTRSSMRRPKRSPNAFLVCRRNVLEEASRKGTYNMRV